MLFVNSDMGWNACLLLDLLWQRQERNAKMHFENNIIWELPFPDYCDCFVCLFSGWNKCIGWSDREKCIASECMPVRCKVCVFVLLLLLACLYKSHSIKRGLLSSWTDDWRALEWNIGQLGSLLVRRIEEQLANIMKWVSYWRGFTWIQVDLWWQRKPSNWKRVTWTDYWRW